MTGSTSDSPTSSATYVGTVSGSGGSSTCTTQVLVGSGFSAACADTVVILAGQGNTSQKPDEKNAVDRLLTLYSNVTPHPSTSIGTYAGLDGSSALIPGPSSSYPNGQLAADYTNLRSLNTLILNTNIPSGTNISAGINAAVAELNSSRHDPSHQKVLILTSPAGAHTSDTQAAVLAAATAKNGGVIIFTLNFGTGAANDTWAQIASDSTNEAGTSNQSPAVDPENSDGDKFFVVPTNDSTGTAITGLFDAIAKAVCPAVAPPQGGGGGGSSGSSSGSSGISVDSWGECSTLGSC